MDSAHPHTRVCPTALPPTTSERSLVKAGTAGAPSGSGYGSASAAAATPHTHTSVTMAEERKDGAAAELLGNANFMDLYSRQIGAYGIETMAKVGGWLGGGGRVSHGW